jgi:hypothetical protein
MVLFEVAMRAVSAVFSTHALTFVIGATISGFLMLYSSNYSQFIYDISQYITHLYYVLMGI